MKTKEFNALKKEVRNGNFKRVSKEVIQDLTLNQAKTLEDVLLDLELNIEGNQLLDLLAMYIDSLVAGEKVANKKALKKPTPTEAPEAPTEKKTEKKEEKKATTEKKESNILDRIKVGDVVKFRVEGEEVEHPIKIIYISKFDVIAITTNEKEVFKIRKTDFKKQMFNWRDRNNNEYNIIVTL